MNQDEGMLKTITAQSSTIESWLIEVTPRRKFAVGEDWADELQSYIEDAPISERVRTIKMITLHNCMSTFKTQMIETILSPKISMWSEPHKQLPVF